MGTLRVLPWARTFHQADPPDPPAGWTRESSFSGHQLVCDAVLDFFDAQLRHDSSGLERLKKDMASAAITSFSIRQAATPIPSTQEFLALIRRDGVDAAAQIAEKLQLELSGETVRRRAGSESGRLQSDGRQEI